ncbi:hypothetical protein GCM10011506_07080 [Marivirga lumbricoides]|uniref:Transmembrane protein n=1 Tax=Marivirga lumbricoides TaxID=1046115 RepID=A0ABQ1LGU3_9BACT|nr:hypothetical protein GCM10011506_07080 [Marivirga lumbricoides]
MKIFLKLLLFAILILIAIFEVYIWNVRNYETQMSKVTHVDIYLSEPITNLEFIELIICDSIYQYSLKQIQDTICENIAISNRQFPCFVELEYQFTNGGTTRLKVDSFNCAGCSGSNSYALSTDEVTYSYTD